jgi:hypothetical protein
MKSAELFSNAKVKKSRAVKPILTAAQRTAFVLRDNRNNPFCVPLYKTVDTDKRRGLSMADI